MLGTVISTMFTPLPAIVTEPGNAVKSLPEVAVPLRV